MVKKYANGSRDKKKEKKLRCVMFFRKEELAWMPFARLRCFFEIKLLALAGFQPHLDGCVLCRSAFDPASVQRIYFSSERGGTVCARCSGGLGMPISLGTARTLSNAARSDVNKLSRLKSGNGMVAESETLLDDFIRHHIGKELKTKRFLARLKNPRPCSSVP